MQYLINRIVNNQKLENIFLITRVKYYTMKE